MQHFARYFLLLSLFLTTGCATVLEGRTQQITVKSDPEGAQCFLKQADDIVARVTTPGTVEVHKTKNDLVILCSKAGYESASVKNRSDLALTSLGNMALYDLSFVGNAVDSLSGANNKYDSEVMVKLADAETPSVFPAPPGMPPVVKMDQTAALSMSLQVPMPGVPLTPIASAAPAMLAEPRATAAPVTAVTATPPASSSASLPDPAIRAAASLGKAAQGVASVPSPAPQQVAQLSYAQQVAESSRRPPFE